MDATYLSGDGRRDPLGARRFRRIARRRKDVAWWPRESQTPEYLYRPGEVLTTAESAERAREALKSLGAHTERSGKDGGGDVVRLLIGSRVDLPELLDELEHEHPDLAGLVTPNHWFLGAPYRHFGPGTEPAEPPRAASVETAKEGGDGAVVAIVDSGFLEEGFRHSWLADRVECDADDFEDPDLDRNGFIDFDAGHGTFVAGCVRQVAPGSTLVVEQALDRDGLVTEADLAVQVAQALRRQPHVLNLSLGAYTRDDRAPLGLASWEKRLREDTSVVVVAAAGNDATEDRFYPAALPWVVGVGATTEDGTARASFSNYGDWVDCCARGENLVNAYGSGRYRTKEGAIRSFHGLATWSGTSFAAPLVAGAIAARMEGGRLSPAEARDRVLAESATSIAGIGAYVAT
jgi:subtilisin family serine protease